MVALACYVYVCIEHLFVVAIQAFVLKDEGEFANNGVYKVKLAVLSARLRADLNLLISRRLDSERTLSLINGVNGRIDSIRECNHTRISIVGPHVDSELPLRVIVAVKHVLVFDQSDCARERDLER